MKNITHAFLFFSVAIGMTDFAWCKNKEHRHEQAHSHSSGELHLAFEGNKGVIEFKAAAKGILGFEGKPTSQSQLNKSKEIYELFQRDFGKMIILHETLKCTFILTQNEQVFDKKHKSHSDYQISAQVTCDKPIKGSFLEFNFASFKDLRDIDVTILVDEIQKSLEITAEKSKIELD